jgi:hypothetical protein
MAINDDKLYEEIGQRWLHYVSWREKIFAGYLSVLAALAFTLSKSTGIPAAGAAVFAFAILISVLFRILDFRTTELVNLCQAEADDLAGRKGFFEALNVRRFAGEEKRFVYYGMAINILVASVIAASLVGCLIYLRMWQCTRNRAGWWVPSLTVAVAVLIEESLRNYSNGVFEEERRQHFERRRSKTG